MKSKIWLFIGMLLLSVLVSSGCALNVQRTPPSAEELAQSFLMNAVVQDDLVQVQQGVAQGGDPLKPNQYGRAPFIVAVDNGRESIVRYLLGLYSGNVPTAVREQPLILAAARSGSVAVLEMLLEAGFSLDVKTSSERTPLLIAASMGHTDMVKALIARSVAQAPDDNERITALKLAITEQHEAIADYLISQGAPPFLDTTDVISTYSSAISHQLAAKRAQNLQPDQAKTWLQTAIDLFERASTGAEALSQQAEDTRSKVWRSELLAYLLLGVSVAAGNSTYIHRPEAYTIRLDADNYRWEQQMLRDKFAAISEHSKQRMAECNALFAELER